jgi:hypothetical protein
MVYLFAALDVGELAQLLAVLAGGAVAISVANAASLFDRGSGGDAHQQRRNGNERLGNEHRIRFIRLVDLSINGAAVF